MLSSLAGLNTITYVHDISLSSNAVLTNLSGLPVSSIPGDLQIGWNTSLANLTALNGLDSIGGQLLIGYNPSLTSLSGLDSLKFIGNNLKIVFDSALVDLSGLNALKFIGEGVLIEQNTSLISLSGLDSLTIIGGLSIFGNLVINENPLLTSLTGLNSLTSIVSMLQISGNPTLTSLTALNSLTSIGGVLAIISNDALTSLSGLDNINPLSIGDLYIFSSPFLSTCEVSSICSYLSIPTNPYSISGNAINCDNKLAILAACNGNPTTTEILVQNNKIEIYPNPTNNIIKITGIDKSNITIIKIVDAVGRLVKEEKSSSNTFNLYGLSKGVYFVTIENNHNVVTKRLFII